MVHQGDLLGALSLTKPPSDPLTPTEERLMSDLAGQAGLVLRNVRLIEDLRQRDADMDGDVRSLLRQLES